MNLDEIALPEAPKPLGQYVPAVTVGRLLFLSGMLPLHEGRVLYPGVVGSTVTIADARAAVELAVLNALATAKAQLGSLNRVQQVARLGVVLKTTETFERHAEVADAGSALLASLFGELGHTRLVSGAASLVRSACAMVDVVFALKEEQP